MYPFEKYRYYTNGRKVIAVSSYAGKTVRGVAKCASEDEFDLEKGKQLAALRCALKIARKRHERASRKVWEAREAFIKAEEYLDRMEDYADDAYDEVDEIEDAIYDLLEDM